MNPGVTEEVGKTTRSFFDAMKDNPALLVMAIANLALIIFMYFALSAAAEFRTELIRQSFEFQKQAADLLSRCIIQPGPRSEYKLQDFESTSVPMPPERPADAPRP
jgi:hypothetical protein